MNDKPYFRPTAENTYIFEGGMPGGMYDFGKILADSRREEPSDVAKACNMRFEAFQRFTELVPDNEEVTLDWEDKGNREVLELGYASGIDHFLACDWEMAAAMFEMLLDLDPEDHLEATKPLAYSYVALGEYELFDEIIDDISDKYPDKTLLNLWSEYRRTGKIPAGELTHLKKNFSHIYDEFTAGEHPADERYMQDIESERPSKRSLAREMWLQTEHIWEAFPGFTEALKRS